MIRSLAGSLSGNVWRVWADYWTERGGVVPPLHLWRNGAGDDLFFVVPLSTADLAAVLPKLSTEIRFRLRGAWAAPSSGWFGHWSVFSASWPTGVRV